MPKKVEKLENFIAELGSRFLSMKKEPVVVDAENKVVTMIEVDLYPNIKNYNWEVFGFATDEIKIKKRENRDGNGNIKPDHVYYIFSTFENITFVDLLKICQIIIDTNTHIEEKRMLLELKMIELTNLFTELEYDELKSITFKYRKKNKRTTTVNKKDKVEEENVQLQEVVSE